MCEREEAEKEIILIETTGIICLSQSFVDTSDYTSNDIRRGITGSNDILVSDDDSLWRTGCSGSIHDTSQVFRFGESRLVRRFLAGFEEFIVGYDFEMIMSFLQCFDIFGRDIIFINNVLDVNPR